MNRILYVVPYIPFPNNKAANLFISKRIELLSKEYIIDLISVTNGKYDVNITNYKINNFIEKFYFVKRDSFGLGAVFKAIINKESLFNLLSLVLLTKIKKLLKISKYKYIIVEHSYLASFIINNIPNLENKIITIFHNIETDYFKDLFYKTSLLNPKKYFFYLEYKGCQRLEKDLYNSESKAFWFLSKHDLEFVRKQTSNKNLLLSNTIKFDLKKHLLNKKKYDLLYMGQLDNQRNLHGLKWFIENVWKLLKNEDLSFAIAGRGDITDLKIFTKNYSCIDIVGEVENLDNIFSKSKITIIPIFNTIGVQTKLFDSLAQGNIVICTKDVINGTNFVDNEHLLVAKNAMDFKEKILSALNNKRKYEFIYNNLKLLKDDFKNEKLLEDMQRSMNEK